MGRLPAVLAVDGGNSKADLAVLADDGTVLAALRRPGFSHQTVGLEQAALRLDSALAELRQRLGLAAHDPVAHQGAFCLAGADLPIDDEQLGQMLADAQPTRRWSLHNDVFAVLRAGTDGAGVAVVCGAGMNCVGVAPDGREVRYPALGELSGDLSTAGGWLGRRALAMAIRAVDGRGAATSLARQVPAHFGVDRPLDVTEAIYTGELDERRLLELAPIVMAAAERGDDVAGRLITAVGDEVVALVRATSARLDLFGHEPTVVLGGGLFRGVHGLLRDHIVAGIATFVPTARVQVLDHHPIVGAALLGFDELGTSAAVAATVRSELDRAIEAGDRA